MRGGERPGDARAPRWIGLRFIGFSRGVCERCRGGLSDSATLLQYQKAGHQQDSLCGTPLGGKRRQATAGGEGTASGHGGNTRAAAAAPAPALAPARGTAPTPAPAPAPARHAARGTATNGGDGEGTGVGIGAGTGAGTGEGTGEGAGEGTVRTAAAHTRACAPPTHTASTFGAQTAADGGTGAALAPSLTLAPYSPAQPHTARLGRMRTELCSFTPLHTAHLARRGPNEDRALQLKRALAPLLPCAHTASAPAPAPATRQRRGGLTHWEAAAPDRPVGQPARSAALMARNCGRRPYVRRQADGHGYGHGHGNGNGTGHAGPTATAIRLTAFCGDGGPRLSSPRPGARDRATERVQCE